MKKIVVSLLFALLAVPQVFANAYSSDEYDDEEEESVYETPRENAYSAVETPTEFRNSFFWRIIDGLNLEYGNVFKDGDKGKEWADFNAYGEALSVQVGANFKRLFAVFFATDFIVGNANYCPNDEECLEGDFYKFDIGVGSLVYPFREVPVLNGVNFGVSVGFECEFLSVQSREYEDETDMAVYHPGAAFKFELGYSWDVFKRVSLGLEFNFTYNLLATLADQYDDCFGEDTYASVDAYSIGILLNVMRR